MNSNDEFNMGIEVLLGAEMILQCVWDLGFDIAKWVELNLFYFDISIFSSCS